MLLRLGVCLKPEVRTASLMSVLDSSWHSVLGSEGCSEGADLQMSPVDKSFKSPCCCSLKKLISADGRQHE